VTALSSTSLGTYLVYLGQYANVAGAVTSAGGSTNITLSGCTLRQIAQSDTGGVRNAEWWNMNITQVNGINNAPYNPTGSAWIVTFAVPNSSFSLPTYYGAASVVYLDLFMCPYNTPNIGKVKPQGTDNSVINELRLMISELKNNQQRTNDDFIRLKQEITDADGVSDDDEEEEECDQKFKVISTKTTPKNKIV